MAAAIKTPVKRPRRIEYDSENLSAEHPDLLKRHRDVLAGLPFEAVRLFEVESGLTRSEVCQMLGIPYSTLARRRNQNGGRLTVDESDRLARCMRLFRRSVEFLGGSPESARRWLRSTHHALGGQRPMDLARTESGALEVESVIFRVMNGVYV